MPRESVGEEFDRLNREAGGQIGDTMWEEWTDPLTGTRVFRVQITEADGQKMTKAQYEMLSDGAMLMKHALRGDTAPKWLSSVCAMSHCEDD